MLTQTDTSVKHGPTRESVDAVSKAIQSAVWRMSLTEFCAVLGWKDDSYATDKFREFQVLGQALARFDAATLGRLVSRHSQASHGPDYGAYLTCAECAGEA